MVGSPHPHMSLETQLQNKNGSLLWRPKNHRARK